MVHGSDEDLSQNAVIPETDDELFPSDTDNLEYGHGSDPSAVSTVYFSCIKLRYCIACPAIIFYSLCLFLEKISCCCTFAINWYFDIILLVLH